MIGVAGEKKIHQNDRCSFRNNVLAEWSLKRSAAEKTENEKTFATKMIGVKMIGWKQNRVFLFENDRSFWWQVTVLKNPGNQQKPRQSTYLDEYMLFKKNPIKKY